MDVEIPGISQNLKKYSNSKDILSILVCGFVTIEQQVPLEYAPSLLKSFVDLASLVKPPLPITRSVGGPVGTKCFIIYLHDQCDF